MTGIWYIVVPEAGTNYVKNPSAELDGNFGLFLTGSPSQSNSPSGSASPSSSASISPSGSTSPSASQSNSPSASQSRSPSRSASPSGSSSPSTSVSPSPSPSAQLGAVTRSTTYARFGNYAYKVTPSAAYDGMHLALSTLANAIHYVSLYLFDNVTGSVQVSLDGNAFYDMAVIGGADGSWVRYGVQVPAAFASGSTRLFIRLTADEDFYIDGVQVEQNSYGTTYIDGDRGPLYRWSGLRHGSSSTRSAQERTGGRERNLLDDYSVEVREGTKRIGTPPITHNLLSTSLLPGALYQGSKVLPREVELAMHYTAETWAGFHAARRDLFDLLKPDLVRGAQPITIGYAGPGTGNKVYAQFYYSGGLEFGDFLAYDEIAAVRLLAPDPFWYADTQETASLDYQDSITTAYAAARIGGQWQALSSGFNNTVRAIAVDKQRGRVYFGGSFTSPANRICYWDGTRFVSMGLGIGDAIVYAIAIAPNGDVWVGGTFTVVDGTGSRNYIARWNISTGTWTNFGTTGTSAVYAICIDNSGIVYVGGNFTNWNGDAAQDYITSYTGSWAAVGTQPFTDAVLSMSYDGTNIWVGSQDSTLQSWSGSAWTLRVTATGSLGGIYCVCCAKDGVYFGGAFTSPGAYIAVYNGSSSQGLGTGLGFAPWTITELDDGTLFVSGAFVTAGGLSLADRCAIWNKSAWVHTDADFPGSPIVYANKAIADSLFVGFDTTGSASVSGITQASNAGTAFTFPRLDVINLNSSGSCILQWFENQSSGHRMYFNLTVQAGETATLDMEDSQKRLISDWRGLIQNNPLAASDVVNWRLLPGANTIAAFITGTVTSVSALLHWVPRYWSADGNA